MNSFEFAFVEGGLYYLLVLQYAHLAPEHKLNVVELLDETTYLEPTAQCHQKRDYLK